MRFGLNYTTVDPRRPPEPRVDVIVRGPAAAARMLGLVDSGADASLIPHEIADQLGIDLEGATRQRMWGNGAWNDAWLLPEPVPCELVELGGLTVPLRPVVGHWPGLVLGRDFFRHCRVEFDERAGAVWLEPYTEADPAPPAAVAIATPAPLTVTNPNASPIRFLEWGATYDLTSPMQIDSDQLVTSGFSGTQTTLAGAYDPNATGNSVIAAPMLSVAQAICGTGSQPHTGTYRVKARIYAAGSTNVSVRLAWRDGIGPVTANGWVQQLIADHFVELDLGLIMVDGDWSGQIEAYGSGTLNVDVLRLMPVSVGYAKVRAPASPDQTAVVVAYDAFTATTAGGALNGRTPQVGAAWATTGAAGDFAFIDAGAAGNADEAISRSASSSSPRQGVFGSAMTDMQVRTRFGYDNTAFGLNQHGVIARWVDASNYLQFTVSSTGGGALIKNVAGIPFVLASSGGIQRSEYIVELTVSATGRVTARIYDAGGILLREYVAQHADLATGGALASGKPGIFDRGDGATTKARWFDQVTAAIPPTDSVVIQPGRKVSIAHDRVNVESADGLHVGPPATYRGKYFVIPPAGSKDRATRLVVFAHTNDLEVDVCEPATVPLIIQTTYTPRIRVVPV